MSGKSGRRPILVTGSHRSGTTWAGRNLALAPNTGYIQEPFNVEEGFPYYESPLDHWFQCVCEENGEEYREAIDRVIRFRYPLLRNLLHSSSPRDVARALRDCWRMLLHRLAGRVPIVKDPIAFFSAEWLCSTYGMRVLVLVRHPAAFCSSLKIKGWGFDFSNFLDQPLLMERYLGRFEEEIREQAEVKRSIMEQAILLWRCIYGTVGLYAREHPEWLYVRHEDLSVDPLGEFESLFDELGLEFTRDVREGILESSGSHNPAEQRPGDEFRRDSRANVENWKRRLDPAEVRRIRTGTEDVWVEFYDDSEW